MKLNEKEKNKPEWIGSSEILRIYDDYVGDGGVGDHGDDDGTSGKRWDCLFSTVLCTIKFRWKSAKIKS